jgi:hypothetical protein
MVHQHRAPLGNRSLTPITSSSYDPGNLNLSYRGAFQRPDCIGNSNVRNSATGSMFNNSAFNPIPSGPVGTCGVGILEGPGTTTIAAGLSKRFHVTERMRLRFESTFTKLLNHPNFAPPPTNVTTSSFGVVQSSNGRTAAIVQGSWTCGLNSSNRLDVVLVLALYESWRRVNLGWNADLALRRNAAHLPATQISDTAYSNFAFACE